MQTLNHNFFKTTGANLPNIKVWVLNCQNMKVQALGLPIPSLSIPSLMMNEIVLVLIIKLNVAKQQTIIIRIASGHIIALRFWQP